MLLAPCVRYVTHTQITGGVNSLVLDSSIHRSADRTHIPTGEKEESSFPWEGKDKV